MSYAANRFKTAPLKHQLECLNQFGGRKFFALNSEQGTGKTWIIINDIADLWASHEVDAVLVFAPNGVHHNWIITQLPEHMPEWVRYRAIAWSANAKKKERDQIEAIVGGTDSTELRILTMNWEALQTSKGFEFAKRFCTSCRRLMIVGDESQKIKNPSAERTKQLMKLKPMSNYRRTMSGTPVTNGPFDAFSQYTFLDEEILGTTSYYAFKAEYADMISQDHHLVQHIIEKKVGLSQAAKAAINEAASNLFSALTKNGRLELIEVGERISNLVESGIYDQQVIEANEELRSMFSPNASAGKTYCLQLMAMIDGHISERVRKVNGFKNSNRIPQIVDRNKDGSPRYKNLHKLEKLIAPHTYRITKAECLDLPEKVYKDVWFDLTKEQQEVYNTLKEECRIVFEGEQSPVHRLAALTKMAQIGSGFYIHPDTKQVIKISGDNPKLELFEDRLQTIVEEGSSVIVWARFIEEIKQLEEVCNRLEIPCVKLYGDVKRDDRLEGIRAFEAGEVQVFIGQQQAGGTGITLVHASHVIYYSNTFSLEDRLQSEDRAHRIGQDKTVTYTNLMARDTIDVSIAKALHLKKNIADLVTGDSARLWGLN